MKELFKEKWPKNVSSASSFVDTYETSKLRVHPVSPLRTTSNIILQNGNISFSFVKIYSCMWVKFYKQNVCLMQKRSTTDIDLLNVYIHTSATFIYIRHTFPAAIYSVSRETSSLSCYTSHKWIFNLMPPGGYLRKGFN